MLEKHTLIMLNYIAYGDTSMIVRCYSNKRGPISLIINGVRKKKSKIQQAQIQPLQIQEAEIIFNPKKDLHKVKELHAPHQLQNLVFDIFKNTQCQFLGEVLYKSLKEEIPNPALFDFIKHAILFLNETEKPNNFHIQFLVSLSKQLGFHPNIGEGKYLDLVSGTTSLNPPNHSLFINLMQSPFWVEILQREDWNLEIQISTLERQKILDQLIQFFELHLEGFGTVSSLKVLKEIFHQ